MKTRDQILNKSFTGDSTSGIASNRNSFSENTNNNINRAMTFNLTDVKHKSPSLMMSMSFTPNKALTSSVMQEKNNVFPYSDFKKNSK